ncbi:interferon-inducible GTPase 5-like [Crotalus tigris]|uniref:interferon-inducible GTPase 5-like n=1 Tax=Crotalus tigris TaxID=88082 RepID=UPI00192FA997|nr:interferon-inducible GTPase 5-like [Crotalus tigris]
MGLTQTCWLTYRASFGQFDRNSHLEWDNSSGHDYGTFGSSCRKKIEAAVSEGNLTEALSHILEEPSKSFADFPLNVAVIGEPDAGKSSFINTMQSPDLDEPVAADIATDHTSAEFRQINFSEITWNKKLLQAEDADGKEVDLKDFHYFIIVDPKICQALHLALKIQKMDKEFSLVQTKADLQLEEAKKQQPSKDDDESLLLTKDSCRESLRNKGVKEPQIFTVSNKEPKRFDFPFLRKTLMNNLWWKKILVSLSPVLEAKAGNMKRKIWFLTVLSGFIAGIPIPGIAFLGGLVILIMFGSWCCHKFGVDDESLSKLAKFIKVVLPHLKSIMTSQSKKKMILQKLPDSLGASVMTAEYFYWKHFPIIGCILSVVVSLISSFFTLNKLPSDVKKDTENVLIAAIKPKKTDLKADK